MEILEIIAKEIKSYGKYIFVTINSASYSQKELDKLKQLKDWAFSAAQNGDLEAAIAAITGDNVAAIKNNVEKFMEIKRQHEEAMQQMEQQLKQEENKKDSHKNNWVNCYLFLIKQ